MLEIPGTQVQRSMCSCAGLIRSDHPNVKFRGKTMERHTQEIMGMMGKGGRPAGPSPGGDLLVS